MAVRQSYSGDHSHIRQLELRVFWQAWVSFLVKPEKVIQRCDLLKFRNRTKSPAINASFFALDHFLSCISRDRALEKSVWISIQRRATGGSS